jgi:hypothetical protein
MFELSFAVTSATPVPHAAVPALAFGLRLTARAAADVQIQSILLRCQVRIEPVRRQYGGHEHARLHDLFGPAKDWGRTLHAMLWAHTNTTVMAFEGTTEVELLVPCSYDFNVAATKYFDGLEGDDVPLCFLFSGTIFYTGGDGRLQVAQVPWDKEANFRLPVQVWKAMMELYYPNRAWVEVGKDVFDRLRQYARAHGLTNPEQAVEALLAAHGVEATP